jgi:excisionase family DNA binding protein
MSEEYGTILRIPRMRTLSEVYAYIREADPDTAISANYVRCLIISGKIPRVRCGKKYLIDIDLLQDHLTKCMQGND